MGLAVWQAPGRWVDLALFFGSLRHHYRAVVVAVVAMGVMEVAVDKVIDVVAMGDGGMTAGGAVLVRSIVAAGRETWRPKDCTLIVLVPDYRRDK
jgi:hypothetical protein